MAPLSVPSLCHLETLKLTFCVHVIKVSVIICCYNSASRIERTLQHLLLQDGLDENEFEIIIVDNNSTDETATSARQVLVAAKCEWQIVVETKPGLTAARLAGTKAARGEYLLFCDDDNWLSSDYIVRSKEFLDHNPTYGAVGGFGEAVADVSLPEWFESVAGMYACDVTHGYDDLNRDALTGAGLVVRRKCLEEIDGSGIVYALTDREGSKLTSGGDSEITMLIKLHGWRLAKLSALRFQHYMPPVRLTEDYAVKLTQGIGSSMSVLSVYRMYFRSFIRFRSELIIYPLNLYLLLRWTGRYLRSLAKRGFVAKLTCKRLEAMIRQLLLPETMRFQRQAVRNALIARALRSIP